MNYYLAIDIGASSGRHIVGWKENGAIKTEEVYRFPNGVKTENGHLIWDIETLLKEVKTGIDRALAAYRSIESLSVDTWGVDYVLLGGPKADEPLYPVYAYRDSRTEAVIDQVHERIPFAELYAKTGIQFQPFNTIYQLYADKITGRLQDVTDFLMLPEYLLYRLSGVTSHEYTNATTGGMVNATTGEYDLDIISALDLPKALFKPLQQPGTRVGAYKGISCVLCATHDTGSAVEGIPMAQNQPYISSGTWSLLGVKVPRALTDENSMAANWSNEGGVGYIRYQKNIMGMWLINRLRDELCPSMPFDEIVDSARSSNYNVLIDANAAAFLAPQSMQTAFDEAISASGAPAPVSIGDYFSCAYRSLARSYAQAYQELEANTGKSFSELYIVGGGAKNAYLNELTEAASGKTVHALAIEATALGNLKVQMEVVS